MIARRLGLAMIGAVSRSPFLALVLLLAACAGPSSPADPSGEPTSPVDGVDTAGLPPGCDPLDLRSPTGERVDLTGEWDGTGLAGEGARLWIKQIGDCFYGSIVGGYITGVSSDEASVTNLDGRIGSDFRIGLDHVLVFQDARFTYADYSPLVMLIEWDDEGRLRLREEREANEPAARCDQENLDCSAISPYLWYRVEPSP